MVCFIFFFDENGMSLIVDQERREYILYTIPKTCLYNIFFI